MSSDHAVRHRALCAAVRGVAVEYAVGELDLVSRVVGGAVDANPSAEVQVTLFDGGDVVAGIRIAHGTVDVAAREPDVLERISLAARVGLPAVIDALTGESKR